MPSVKRACIPFKRSEKDPSAGFSESHKNNFISSSFETSCVTHLSISNAGKLLLFPAYLYHSVDENLSDDDRIVISFNIDIIK